MFFTKPMEDYGVAVRESPIVLVLAGIELIFLIGPLPVPRSGSVLEPVLIAQGCVDRLLSPGGGSADCSYWQHTDLVTAPGSLGRVPGSRRPQAQPLAPTASRWEPAAARPSVPPHPAAGWQEGRGERGATVPAAVWAGSCRRREHMVSEVSASARTGEAAEPYLASRVDLHIFSLNLC